MRVVFGTDESTPLTEAVQARLRAWGHDVEIVADPAPWPEAGRSVGEAVALGRAEMGVVCCWTGTGVTIAANKVPGVRAALCGDAETARGARRWNDANVLALSLRLTSVAVAEELLDAFLTTGPEPSEAALIAAVESSPASSRR
jgi:ribose 5-phosphate isomerase B